MVFKISYVIFGDGMPKYRGRWVVWKMLKTPLHNINMVPYVLQLMISRSGSSFDVSIDAFKGCDPFTM